METQNPARKLDDDRPALPLPNTYWVIPGRLLAGEHPTGTSETDTRARLGRLMDGKIDSYIDLTEPGEQPEYGHLLAARFGYLRSPIVDTSVPHNIYQTVAVISSMREGLGSGRNIYVHCRAGIGRTGLVVGCFLAEELGDGRRAVKELNRLWRQSARARSWPTIPQTAEQADYIRRWPKLRKLGSKN